MPDDKSLAQRAYESITESAPADVPAWDRLHVVERDHLVRLVSQAVAMARESENSTPPAISGRSVSDTTNLLAFALHEVAEDLVISGTDEWESVPDMLHATLNNIKHDFGEALGDSSLFMGSN